MSKTHGNCREREPEHLWFANREELRQYITKLANRIGWTYNQAVRMSNEDREMDYPEMRVEIQQLVWLLEYADILED